MEVLMPFSRIGAFLEGGGQAPPQQDSFQVNHRLTSARPGIALPR